MSINVSPDQEVGVHFIGPIDSEEIEKSIARRELVLQHIPTVQKHLGHSNPKNTEILLSWIIFRFKGEEFEEALGKFVNDLLQNNSEALAVDEADKEVISLETRYKEIYYQQYSRISKEKGEPIKISLRYDSALSRNVEFEDIESHEGILAVFAEEKHQEIYSLVAKTQEFRLITGDVILAQEKRRLMLKAWTNLYWPDLHWPEFAQNAIDAVSAPKKRHKFPSSLPGLTFAEVKAGTLAISDGRDRRNWSPIEGALALLHKPQKAAHQVRFEPNNILVTWWGKPPANADSLWSELEKMDMDSVMLYHVVLANILFDPKARFTASIDEMIKAIGREGEAKRNAEKRAEWRHKVWRALLLFDSLAIIGARSGTWKEPQNQEGRRVKMAEEKLISRDPLFRIIGTRETEQGSFDKSEPPKEVSLVPGEWLMQFHGNREILSDLGDVLKIAAIPRGKAAGNWAACIGLMLNQLWRERAAKATRKRAGDEETLDFGTFTRRQLLEKTLRSDCDVSVLLQDPKSGHRCREYWKTAIQELKNADIIGHYSEGEESPHEDWRERWLDQSLDIRPKSAMPQVLEINASAAKARKRTPRKKAPKLEVASDDSSVE